MKILVTSCDKNDDTFEAFHHCIEKYWPKHPEVIYSTETKKNPYYKTICKDYPLNLWTRRMRETLAEIDDDRVLFMADDCFIRHPVDTERMDYILKHWGENLACFNLERSWDPNDEDTEFEGVKKRRKGSRYEVSLMIGIWDREKLVDILRRNCDPWTIEEQQFSKGYDYYINGGADIIDFGYYHTWIPFGISRGKWCREVVPFFEHEGIQVDYSRKGFRG